MVVKKNEGEVLKQAYRNCLDLARKNGIRSIAFPSISTGAYRFPVDRAAGIAIDTIYTYLSKYKGVFEKVKMVLYTEADYNIYVSKYNKIIHKSDQQ